MSTDVFPGMSNHCQILVSCPPHGNDKRAKHLIRIESDGHDKTVIDCSLLASPSRVERTSGSVECPGEAAELAECQVQCKQFLSGPSDAAIWRTTESSRYVLYVKPLLGGQDYLALARRLRRRLFSSTKTHEKAAQKHVSLPTPDHHSALPRCLLSAQSVSLVPCGRWRD